MSAPEEVLETSGEELFEQAPCGYAITRPDGTIVRVNRTFEAMTGFAREELVDERRWQDLLVPGARIYHETHYAPLLRMEGRVSEIAVELVRRDGTRLSALVNAVLEADAAGAPRLVRTTIFEATDRRRYERELVRDRDRERAIADTLQHSLLAGARPEDPRLELAVGYQPAVDGLEVGGDWYDAFWSREDAIALVVGDVVGRGLEAASVMGQLRSAVRALASTGLGPGPLLDALDGFARRYGVGEMATVAYAELDLGTGELCLACAGHPPPVLAAPDAAPRFVMGGRSAPLDVQPPDRPRPQAELRLEPGAALLLYTDGLFERGDCAIDERLDLLLEEVGARAQAPVADLVAQLPPALLAGSRTRDDVCVVALRRREG